MVLLLKNALFTAFVPGTLAVYVPLRVARGQSVGGALFLGTGIVFLSVGTVVYVWSVWEFAARGKATPAPIDAPRKLVVRGLYRHIRNPMYIAVLTVVLGWGCVFHSLELLFYALAVAACFQAFIVLYEEPHLARTFGSEYEIYCSRAGRWLPKFLKRPAS